MRTELEELQRMVNVYLPRHFSSLVAQSVKACEPILIASNSGLMDGMTALATQGGVLHRNHPFAEPAASTGLPMTTMGFMRLRELVEEGAGTSLV